MNTLTIKIRDISGGKQKAYKAVISELNNSVIYADTIAEIFTLIPEVIEVAEKDHIGIYSKELRKKAKSHVSQVVLKTAH